MNENNSKILEKPFFWYIFICLVVIALFVYGMKLDSNKTIFNTLKIDLQESKVELNEYKKLNANLNSSNDSLIDLVSELNQDITELRISSGILEDSISYLNSIPPKIETQYIDRVVYRNKYIEKTYIYGKGNGKISLYNSCSNSGILKIWINGNYAGSLNKYYTSSTSCPTSSAITKILPAGRHRVYITNGRNTSKEYQVYIQEDRCKTEQVRCF